MIPRRLRRQVVGAGRLTIALIRAVPVFCRAVVTGYREIMRAWRGV